MKKIKELLEKIKYYLKRLLKKEDVLLIKANSNIEQNNKENTTSENDIDIEKKEFFELYKNFKNGNISMDDLMINELIKVLLMLENEVLVYDEKISFEEIEIENMEIEIKILEKENESMRKLLQN